MILGKVVPRDVLALEIQEATGFWMLQSEPFLDFSWTQTCVCGCQLRGVPSSTLDPRAEYNPLSPMSPHPRARSSVLHPFFLEKGL